MVASKPSSASGDTNTSREFGYDLTSNFLFVVASGLYLWLAFLDVEYEERIQDIPDDVLQADDDYSWMPFWPYGDDYVFPVRPEADVWVTSYQLIYFVAAYCFVMVGVIDLCNGAGIVTGGLMLLAGLTGLASAALVEKDEHISNILNAASVHLFLLEGIQIMFSHVPASYNGCVKCFLLLGDTSFVAGSVIDVALSYFWIFDKYTFELSRLTVLAAILWVIAALVYLTATIMNRPATVSVSEINAKKGVSPKAGTPATMLTTAFPFDHTSSIASTDEITV